MNLLNNIDTAADWILLQRLTLTRFSHDSGIRQRVPLSEVSVIQCFREKERDAKYLSSAGLTVALRSIRSSLNEKALNCHYCHSLRAAPKEESRGHSEYNCMYRHLGTCILEARGSQLRRVFCQLKKKQCCNFVIFSKFTTLWFSCSINYRSLR